MNEQLELRLRRDLAAVDETQVADAHAVRSAATRAGRRLQARRRIAVGVTSAVVAMAAGGVVWATRPTSDDVVTAPGSSPTETAAPLDTTMPPPTASPPTTAPSLVATPIASDPRGPSYDPMVVWTGTEAIVLGGTNLSGGVVAGASAYDPRGGTWRTLPDPPGPADRTDALVLWTGSEVLALGGVVNGSPALTVEAYNPASDTWRTVVPTSPSITARSPWAWTGDRLLVWPADEGTPIALDPNAASPVESWIVIAPAPIGRRHDAASVWTGSEWIIWGGTGGSLQAADGAAYSPTTDSWRRISEAPIGPRRVSAVWTGTEMLVQAGSRGGDPETQNGTFALADGAAYDPATDTWRPLTSGPAHPGFVPVWTGTHVLMFAKGGMHVYDIAADRWIVDDNELNAPGATPVWTGEQVLAIGGDDPNSGGVLLDPDP